MIRPALSLFFALSAPAAGAASRPNIVVLDICSARGDRFGSRGALPSLTPGLDAFASDATAFDAAWAQSSWCLPNYATLLTGLRPEAHGVYANLPVRPLPEWQPTLAEELKRAGYRTGGFTAGAYTLPLWGLDRGFDEYANRFSTAAMQPGRFSELAPEIEAWLARPSTSPFFLYATVDDLHAPYHDGGDEPDASTASVRFFRAYNGEPLPPGDPLAGRVADFRRDPRGLAALSRRYDAALSAADASVAAFLARLKASGRWNDTLIVVTADHGELLGEHGLLGHTEGLYEPILRVPLIIRHPGRRGAAGRRVKTPVERVDIAPTVVETAGRDPRALSLPGRSLLPFLDDPAAPRPPLAYASSKRNRATAADDLIDERAVRDGRWKLIWSLAKGRWELYDLEADPRETRNLAEKRPEITARLAFLMQAEAERARAPAAGRAGPDPRPAAPALPAARD